VNALLDINAAPHRSVWVFAIDLPLEAIDDFGHETTGDTNTSSWPLGDALGVTPYPEQDGVEIFDLGTLKDYGFSRYLSEANGLELEGDTAMLDALTGHVALVFDTALSSNQTQFAPQAPLKLIGRYAPDMDIAPMTDLESDSAQGQLPEGRPPMSPARISGMVATAVLLFLAVFVVLFVWIAS
jgi:hypothetical protein